ncbi:MAG: DUF4276 family protein [Lewinellaceae bacterium]|nr:DUF4276 family protein [Phaeodactylibacter sp.]MCB9037143.1 DUF4276 family protein [Lewinellaceae bacterium]
MAHIFLIVEGATEEQFYKKTLQGYFINPDGSYRHYIEAVQMPSKKNIYSRENKGGRVSYQACVNNVRRFLNQASHADLFMLIFDYYGLDVTFKDHLTPMQASMNDQVDAIQKRLETEINNPRFRFRLQVHEFEAFLFSKPEIIAEHFSKPSSLEAIRQVLSQFGNDPEMINDDPKTVPSKRLDRLFDKFGKTSDGLIIAQKIGVAGIREKCRRFDQMCREIDRL